MVYDLCVYYRTGTPEGSTESGFMEKPGIEPATPGLQGTALIHYTMGASLSGQCTCLRGRHQRDLPIYLHNVHTYNSSLLK